MAGFGQVDYLLTTRLTLTAGVRVAKQKDEFAFEGAGPLNGGAATSEESSSETPVTPKFGVNLQVTDDSLLYVSAAKGNRIGGGNQPLLNTPACQGAVNEVGLHGTPETYKSDSLWSYEIGSKNLLFDHRLQLDADVYHIDWSNIQQNVHIVACASGFIANLGKATSDGAELSATGQATDHLQLGTSIGYNDAKLSANVGSADAILGYKGDRVGTTPPWTITDWAKYSMVIDGYKTYIRVDDEYNHKNPGPYPQQHASTLGYDPYFLALPSYNLLNFRTGVELHGIDVSLFAMNVLDNHALLQTYNLNVPGRQFGFTNRPLTVGLTAIARW